MSGNTDLARRHGSSLIAPGTRIEGNVEFSGTLHLRGEISGDVRCAGDTGTVIVGESGLLSGSLAAPMVVVRGQIRGPIDTSAKLEIHAGGLAAGDIRYRLLEIHAGGRVNGLLTPSVVPEPQANSARLPRPPSAAAPLPTLPPVTVSPKIKPAAKPRQAHGTRNLWLAGAAVAIVVAIFVATRDDPAAKASPIAALQAPAQEAATTGDGKTTAEPIKDEPPPAKPEPAPPKAAATKTGTDPKPAVESKADAKPTPTKAREEPSERPEGNIATAYTIKGVNAARPDNILFIVTREPVVVYKKKTDDTTSGVRLAFPKGRNTRIRISSEELLRVAQGEDLDLYFQGGKVWSQPIVSGSWMRFEPLEPPPPPAPRAAPATADAAAKPAASTQPASATPAPPPSPTPAPAASR